MDVESPKGSGQVRVRIEGRIDPQTQRGVFRIIDAAGSVLRRIRDARHSQEALALYWRSAGAALPGATMSSELDRRIRRARAGDAGRLAMQTPELPFEADPAADEAAPEADPEENAAPPQSRRQARKPAARLPQTDLFASETAEESAPPESVPPASVSPESVSKESEIEPETPAGSEVEADPVEPREGPQPADPEPRILTAEAVMLQRVDPRHLRPTDRTDSYLYHITNGPDAEVTLRQGLVVSVSDPMILTERQGVSYWLSVLAEDYDYIMDGPADFVVLRLRRMAVEGLLEPDPHASRNSGHPCYLLTGRKTA